MKISKKEVMKMAWLNFKCGPSSVIGDFPRSLKRAWLYYRNRNIGYVSPEDDQAIGNAILATWNKKLF